LLLCLAGGASAHPGHPEDDEPGHDHEADNKAREPTKEQIERQLARVIKRTEERVGQREERKKERKRALAKQLAHRLRGGPISQELKKELALHARRTAFLRQIRYVAAKAADHPTVVACDRALARENGRHEGWWRAQKSPRPEPVTP
jgi:hypothetical protein